MRASLLTGQVPATHGVFVNDVYLRDDGKSLAQLFAQGGYSTGYIGKVLALNSRNLASHLREARSSCSVEATLLAWPRRAVAVTASC